ncbi:MAG: hydroxylamine reductase [Desulfobacterales bacterium]|nr:hydroxylamine reductase [Desulfobacterales bacterium]MCP4162085.1 hydroxylamine reductase [Deltaproteobacteria bacterium]
MSEKKLSRRSFIKKGTMGVAATAIAPAILAATPAVAAKGKNMFCYQCEQTAMGKGCTYTGVCGKTPEVAALQDLLIYTLKGLSLTAVSGKKVGVNDKNVNRFTCEALFSTLTNVEFDPNRIEDLIHETVQYRTAMIKKVKAAGGTIDMKNPAVTFKPKSSISGLVKQGKKHGLMDDASKNKDIRSLQHTLLFGLKGLAAYANHASEFGQEDDAVYEYVHRALASLLDYSLGMKYLNLVLECGEKNLKAMELLDAGNTTRFGHPIPTSVPRGYKKGKAILVSGHDLIDLEAVLKQSEGKGIFVYTHGEMLACHGYPKLKKKYPHLYGHYGSAWQYQKKEFAQFPGSILMTTNCIQKPKRLYKKNIYTTGTVGWPGVKHLENKNYKEVVDKALDLPGFPEDVKKNDVMVGFARNTVLGVADKVIAGVKNKDIRHFFLIGGCDGVKKKRGYYLDFAKQVPKDCVIMTLACGKHRLIDTNFGDIGGIPRLLDVGQCNDAHSAVQIAVELSKAFKVSVNELPLSFILSWYEQKAVAILLSLLHLGIKDIRLGPSLPAFITPNVLKVLVDNYNIMPITTPEKDIKAILG